MNKKFFLGYIILNLMNVSVFAGDDDQSHGNSSLLLSKGSTCTLDGHCNLTKNNEVTFEFKLSGTMSVDSQYVDWFSQISGRPFSMKLCPKDVNTFVEQKGFWDKRGGSVDDHCRGSLQPSKSKKTFFPIQSLDPDFFS